MSSRKKKRKTNQRAFNKTNAQLPDIKIVPNPDSMPNPHMPKIIWGCEGKAPNSVIRRLEKMLNFLRPEDLRNLYAVRVVRDDAIKTPGGCTTGCYYHKAAASGRSEVWITKDRVHPGIGIRMAFGLLGTDYALDTLYHEVGHHVAHKTPGISKYKGEAFAEKYMAGYEQAWRNAKPIGRLKTRILKFLFKFVIVFLSIATLRKVPAIDIFYKGVTGRMSSEEMNDQFTALMEKSTDRGKKKWKHPLEKKKYREKFNIRRR